MRAAQFDFGGPHAVYEEYLLVSSNCYWAAQILVSTYVTSLERDRIPVGSNPFLSCFWCSLINPFPAHNADGNIAKEARVAY